MRRLYILTLIVLSCFVSKAQDTLKNKVPKTFSINQLKSDFVFFRTVMENAHPSLYRYLPKDSVNRYFDTTFNKIDQPLTDVAYWKLLQNILAKVGSGHTTLTLENSLAFNNDMHDILPFSVQIQDNRLFISQLYRKADTTFKVGDEILVINNEYAASILEQMRGLVTGDGYSDSFKDFKIQKSFPGIFNLLHGDQYHFMIFYKHGGHVKKQMVRSLVLRLGNRTAPPKSDPDQIKLTYPADIPATAVLKISNFTYKDYSSIHRSYFKELEKNNIKNLIVDLRDNTGGSEDVCIDLMQYLMDNRFYFHIAQEGVLNAEDLKYFADRSNKSPGSANLTSLQNERSFFRVTNSGNEQQLVSGKRFKGNIYILVNRGTFSAASLFAVAVKAQRECTVIGEETGGGKAGCDGGEIMKVILPETRICLYIPTLWTYSASKDQNTGEGLKPDIEFSYPPGMPYSAHGDVDPIMEVAKKGIIQTSQKLQ